MIEYRWEDGSLVRFDLTLYLRHVYGEDARGKDDVAEARRRVDLLRRTGLSERDAFEAAVAGMRADRDAAEMRVRYIRTWHLWLRLRQLLGAARRLDAREEERVSQLVAFVHDEAIGRQCGVVAAMPSEEIESAVAWYAGLLDAEFREDRCENRGYPQSVAEASWDMVQPEYRHEAAERSGFIILRGRQPEEALKEALGQMGTELDAWNAVGCETPWYNLVREVASLFPHPRRRPDGWYAPRIVRLHHRIHENAMARMTSSPAHVEDDPDLSHVGASRVACVERLTRIHCDRLRIAVHVETMTEAEEQAAAG